MRFVSLLTAAVACSLAGCGASPAPAASADGTPARPAPPASSIDPVTGLPRQAKEQPFPAGTNEHLCTAAEDVVFTCTLEGPPPQALISLCLKKGSPRNDPLVIGRERADGKIEEPFAGQPSQLMITVLEMDKVPFSVELEQRSGGGGFGAEKQTDPKAPGKPPRYRHTLTAGKGEKSMHVACDRTRPIIDNFEAMQAYKL